MITRHRMTPILALTTTLLLILLAASSPLLAIAQDLPDDAASLPISQLLTLASSSLSAGKTSSALSIYDHILSRDPTDFATLYKRATVRLATGQLVKAKDGFREVLTVKEFDQARLMLAKVGAKLGEYDEAKEEVELFLKANKGHAGKDVDDAKALKTEITAAQKDLKAARKAVAAKVPDYPTCLTATTAAIQLSPNAIDLRLLRADCYLHSNPPDYASTIGDLSRASSLSPSLPQYLLIRVSLLSALFTDNGMEIPADSLLSLKRCIGADPESKECKKTFRSLKAVEKELKKLRNWVESGKWMEAAIIINGSSSSTGVLADIEELISTSASYTDDKSPLPATPKIAQYSPILTLLTSTLCRAYISIGQTKKAAVHCESALERDPEDLWGLVGRGDRLIAEESWEEAVRTFDQAFEKSGRSDRSILERLQKAQRLLKQSTAKDYYKVLGVSRDADAKTIKRAYRKATLKAHPDKEGGSEAKMAALNEAYEVISNPELRTRFDNGEDPNDPMQAQGGHPFQQGGGHPFQQFFQQGGGFPGGGFSGGGGSFKVKFG